LCRQKVGDGNLGRSQLYVMGNPQKFWGNPHHEAKRLLVVKAASASIPSVKKQGLELGENVEICLIRARNCTAKVQPGSKASLYVSQY